MNSKGLDLSRRQALSAASALVLAAAVPLTTVSAQSPGAAPGGSTGTNPRGPRALLDPESSTNAKRRAETVLVTGGSGFIGGWCLVELLRRGYIVRTTVRNLSKEAAVRSMLSAEVDVGDRLTFFAADLTADRGWDDAIAGCDFVLHVASPLGGGDAGDVESLVAPARDGTLRVLRAAKKAGVNRVVMTSAATAATPAMSTPDRVSDETTWFDPKEEVDAYRHSKRLAEKAAWEFMRRNPSGTTLSTVLPGAVFGPVLSASDSSSTQVIGRLLQGKVPANPRFGLQIVDVRDLVDLHLRAMTAPRARNERFLGVGEFLWMADIARTLRTEFGTAADKVPTGNMPDFVFRTLALFDSSLRAMIPRLGRMHRHSSAKAQTVLDWNARPVTRTIVDCAQSLIAKGVV